MKTATAEVEITVRRNDNAPVFGRQIYSATISEYLALGSSIIQLDATDNDVQVKEYRIKYT